MTKKGLVLTVPVPQERIPHKPVDHRGQPGEPFCLLTRLCSKNDIFLSLWIATHGACSLTRRVDLSATLAALRHTSAYSCRATTSAMQRPS